MKSPKTKINQNKEIVYHSKSEPLLNRRPPKWVYKRAFIWPLVSTIDTLFRCILQRFKSGGIKTPPYTVRFTIFTDSVFPGISNSAYTTFIYLRIPVIVPSLFPCLYKNPSREFVTELGSIATSSGLDCQYSFNTIELHQSKTWSRDLCLKRPTT